MHNVKWKLVFVFCNPAALWCSLLTLGLVCGHQGHLFDDAPTLQKHKNNQLKCKYNLLTTYIVSQCEGCYHPWSMFSLPSLPLQLTSVGWLIASCSWERHFFNKCLIWNWLASLPISLSCYFFYYSFLWFAFYPPAVLHLSGTWFRQPFNGSSWPECRSFIAPWFRHNYAGINDGSPQMYFFTLFAQPSEGGPEARQSLCALRGGTECFGKVYAERQRDLVFLFQRNYKATTHLFFFSCRANRIVAIICHRLKIVYTLSFLQF